MKSKVEKDLGVVIHDTSPIWYVSQLFGSMYRTLTNMKKAPGEIEGLESQVGISGTPQVRESVCRPMWLESSY